jgi:hypothetical protein
MSFKHQYDKTSEAEKLKFLDSIISENGELQKAFIHYKEALCPPSASFPSEKFIQIIEQTRQEYISHFESVDPEDPDWDNYTPSHPGYIPEWEQYEEASEQEFGAIFRHFANKACGLIIQQKIIDLTARLTGLYEAVRNAEIDDPVNSFEDLNEFLMQEFSDTVNQIAENIRISAIAESLTASALQLLLNYFTSADQHDVPGIQSFENYLLALADKSAQPDQLLAIIDQSGIDRKVLARLVLILTARGGNQTGWLSAAQIYYKENNEIALQLLRHYSQHNQQQFLSLANELFKKEPYYWTEPLSELVTPAISTNLFVEVHHQLMKKTLQFEVFLKMRPYLTGDQIDQILNGMKSYKSIQVKILAIEERYEEIRQIVKRNPDDWYYEELISPILGIYPEFCFTQIRQKAINTLAKERGRSTYQRITELLKLADTIPGLQAQNRILARELYQIKPSLPALKDELRKSGLV